MARPDYISDEDITRWAENIDNDPLIPDYALQSPLVREVCYAGLWLAESLEELGCSEENIVKIQFTAGRLSFGRDPWEVSIELLELFKRDELIYEEDEIDLNSLN